MTTTVSGLASSLATELRQQSRSEFETLRRDYWQLCLDLAACPRGTTPAEMTRRGQLVESLLGTFNALKRHVGHLTPERVDQDVELAGHVQRWHAAADERKKLIEDRKFFDKKYAELVKRHRAELDELERTDPAGEINSNSSVWGFILRELESRKYLAGVVDGQTFETIEAK